MVLQNLLLRNPSFRRRVDLLPVPKFIMNQDEKLVPNRQPARMATVKWIRSFWPSAERKIVTNKKVEKGNVKQHKRKLGANNVSTGKASSNVASSTLRVKRW